MGWGWEGYLDVIYHSERERWKERHWQHGFFVLEIKERRANNESRFLDPVLV